MTNFETYATTTDDKLRVVLAADDVELGEFEAARNAIIDRLRALPAGSCGVVGKGRICRTNHGHKLTTSCLFWFRVDATMLEMFRSAERAGHFATFASRPRRQTAIEALIASGQE